jgi:hypothetical protein
MFSQLSLIEMNTGNDMIYGSYKICEIADYGRMDLKQL